MCSQMLPQKEQWMRSEEDYERLNTDQRHAIPEPEIEIERHTGLIEPTYSVAGLRIQPEQCMAFNQPHASVVCN